MPKADKIELDKRVRMVAEWILMGHSTKDIIAESHRQWHVDERMSYKYKKAAFKLFAEANKLVMKESLDLHAALRLRLYNKLKDKDSPKGADSALRILDSLARLQGLVMDKVDVTSKGEKITPELKVYNANLTLS
jgi:hypothetical protein